MFNNSDMTKINLKCHDNKILNKKFTIAFNSGCPTIKLTNNRVPELVNQKIQEVSSIGTNNNASPKDVFAGIKKNNI